jgi:phage terminase small subunit
MALLSVRKRRFAEAYVSMEAPSATRAAIQAGYSEKSAASIGAKLLADPVVRAAIEEMQAERAEVTGVNAAWVLTRLASEAEADIADLYDDDGALRPVKEWPLIWRQGLVAGIDVEEIKEDGRTVGQVRKLKLSDRIKRIELIGKHVGVQAFRDQVQTTGAISIVISPDDANL